MALKVLQGFKVLPLKFSEEKSSSHQLFIKKHSVRQQSEDKPEDRTLFVLNIPPYTTKESLKAVFSCVGRVRNVIFEDKPTSKDVSDADHENAIIGFKVAYIIYENSDSLSKALKLTDLEPLSTDSHPVETGVQKWAKEYNRSIYDHAALQEKIDILVGQYDKQREKEKKGQKQEDDEGWTVVTKKGRKPGVSRKESVENKLLEKSDKGAQRKHLSDFYTFQKRESKMNRIAEMRKKHEEDKKRIEAMRQARRFRPY